VEVIAIRLVRDRKWSPRITGDLIAIKCWSRQALNYFFLFPMHLKDTYYAPVHITDSYHITRLTFVSLILLIDYCSKTLTENVFIALYCV